MKSNTDYNGFKPLISANITNGGGYVINPEFPFFIGTNVAYNVKQITGFELCDGEWEGYFQYTSTDVPSINVTICCNISAQFAAIDDIISISLYKNGVLSADTFISKQFIAHNSFLNFTYGDQISLNTNDKIAICMGSVNGNELQAMEMNVIINIL